MNQQIRGVKRLCATCGTRFYDLMNKPVCPKCKAEFIIPPPAPPRRSYKPIPQPFQPAPIAAGSAEDVPENDEEETIAPATDEDEETPAEEAAELD
jgi:hypothetical protein